MKIVNILIFAILMTSCIKRKTPEAMSGEILNVKGTILLLSPNSDHYIIIPDNDKSQRFTAANLPDSLKRNGLHVLFSGKKGHIPENARLIGTPLELSQIKEID